MEDKDAILKATIGVRRLTPKLNPLTDALELLTTRRSRIESMVVEDFMEQSTSMRIRKSRGTG